MFQRPFVVYPADPSLLIGDFEDRRRDNAGDLCPTKLAFLKVDSES
jgi:hypothetical protein